MVDNNYTFDPAAAVNALVRIASESSTDDEVLDNDEEALYDLQKTMRLRRRTIRFEENTSLFERNMIISQLSYIGYVHRAQGRDGKYFQLSAQVGDALFRTFKFDFVVKYMLLNHFLKMGDLKYESWDRYVQSFSFSVQKTDVVDGDDKKKTFRFGGFNSFSIKTTPYVAKLYRNSLIKFGKLRHVRCQNYDDVPDSLSSCSYPGSESVDAARLSFFMRLNDEEKWDFVQQQLCWELYFD